MSARDTTGLPSCRTDAGRTVYGGGGIFPDIPLGPEPPTPVWIDRMQVDNVPLQWVDGYLDSRGAELVSLESLVAAPAIPYSAIAGFRAFAAARADSIPQRRGGRPCPAAPPHFVGRAGQVGSARLLSRRNGGRPRRGCGSRGVRPRGARGERGLEPFPPRDEAYVLAWQRRCLGP